MGKYKEIITAESGGVNYKIGVIDRDVMEGSFSRNADSDIDYYGYANYEYDLLDMDGKIDDTLQYYVSEDDAIEAIESFYRSEQEDDFVIPDYD